MCGIIGIIGSPFSAQETYHGLLMLQHRGQDSAGILRYDFRNEAFSLIKNLGHVNQAIDKNVIEKSQSEMSLGHTRYSTIGDVRSDEVQPMMIGHPYGIGAVHNGNIVNYQQLKKYLYDEKKRMLFSQNDLEAIIHLLAEEIDCNTNHNQLPLTEKIIFDCIQNIYEMVRGGYSVVTSIAQYGLVAFKDPQAIRPLVLGKRKLSEEEKKLSQLNFDYSYCFASESNALQFLGYEIVKELEQGEIIIIDRDEKISSQVTNYNKFTPCMFEWIYFASADSTVANKNVYQARLSLGKILGQRLKKQLREKNIDIIVPVPDTSRPSAIMLSEQTGIPYREILIKNRYVQRSFILNNQSLRQQVVKLKLNVVKEEVKDKNILLVDDSIVRGTTSKRIIEMLRDSGANSVSIASTCPPIQHPCFFGIDFPSESELVAFNKDEKTISKELGADQVFYLTKEELKAALKMNNFCQACLDGNYPVDVSEGKKMVETRVKVQ